MNDSIVIVPCKSKDGYVYKFARKKGSEYGCCRCRELGKERSITVVDGAVKGRKDPEVDHHADCEPFPESVVQAQQLDREMRADVRSTGKRSREAFSEMMESVAKKCRTSNEQAEVVANLPSYSEVRRQLARHRALRCTPVPDPLNIPDSLRVTLRGRQVAADDVNFNETFLLYSGQGGRLLMFCAPTELAVIRRTQYLVCDGTFEMAPDTAYQV